MGGEGLCPGGAAVRANLPTGEQIARQICPARCLRGRVQVRSTGQQLSGSRNVHLGHASAPYITRTVSCIHLLVSLTINTIQSTSLLVALRFQAGIGCTFRLQ